MKESRSVVDSWMGWGEVGEKNQSGMKKLLAKVTMFIILMFYGFTGYLYICQILSIAPFKYVWFIICHVCLCKAA